MEAVQVNLWVVMLLVELAISIFHQSVAATIGKGIAQAGVIDQPVVLCALIGAIVGVGAARSASAVRWGVAGNLVWAWIFTIPASAMVAALACWLSLRLF